MYSSIFLSHYISCDWCSAPIKIDGKEQREEKCALQLIMPLKEEMRLYCYIGWIWTVMSVLTILIIFYQSLLALDPLFCSFVILRAVNLCQWLSPLILWPYVNTQTLLDVSAASGNLAHEIWLACLNTLSGKDGGMFDEPRSFLWGLFSATAPVSAFVGFHKVLLGDKSLLTLS